jgi:hypothetical protein
LHCAAVLAAQAVSAIKPAETIAAKASDFCTGATPLALAERRLQIPAHRGQPFRRIADSVPVIADSF